MAILTQLSNFSRCHSCKRRNNWGKYNCRKCCEFYSSEFQTTHLTHKQEKRLLRKESPLELVKMYTWLRDNVFPKGYVLPANQITFSYKRNGSNGAWCKGKGFKPWAKEIRMAHNEGYDTMLHEMLHLRLPHHRKSFHQKEQELLKIYELKKNLIQ